MSLSLGLLGSLSRIVVVLASLALLSQDAHPVVAATTFTVNSTLDTDDASPDGECDSDPGVAVVCTLREAIREANFVAGADTIGFNIFPTGHVVIATTSSLPAITEPVTVDGATQPPISSTPLVELKCTSCGAGFDGLTITAGGSTVKALTISCFLTGIRLEESGGNFIQGNFIGTNFTGTAPGPGNCTGIYITSSNNVVGGTTGAARNLISGNCAGIRMSGAGTTGNLIQGNYIGTNVSGTFTNGLGNGTGVDVSDGPTNTVGGFSPAARNVISGNGVGVSITSSAGGNVVVGNYIGTDPSGTEAVMGSGTGVSVTGPQTVIGGIAPGAGNVISGNGTGINISGAEDSTVQGNLIGTTASGLSTRGNSGAGIAVSGSGPILIGGDTSAARNVIAASGGAGISLGFFSARITIQGNFIGTDASGDVEMPNQTGVSVLETTQPPEEAVVIGGSSLSGEGNVISGNSEQGIVLGSGTHNVRIQGNQIGVQATSVVNPLPNGSHGIEVGGNGTDIGDVNIQSLSLANHIGYNGGDGIRVASGLGHTIMRNSIYSNGGLGINLFANSDPPSGVTPNDDKDPDNGPNDLQNYPVLLTAGRGIGTTTIQGTLNSLPVTAYRIEFFVNPSCDSSGYGEGSLPRAIFADPIVTDGNGNHGFTLAIPAVDVGAFVTATVTEIISGNTSEFSNCVVVVDCTLDPDGDKVDDCAETHCGSDPNDPNRRPERLDGVFDNVDDNGDTQIDETLPPGSEGFDCDGDGWTGGQEKLIYAWPTTANDQDPCGNNGWPADLTPVPSTPEDYKLNIGDLNSFLFPLRNLDGDETSGEIPDDDDGHGVFNKFGHPLDDTVPPDGFIDGAMARWDLQLPLNDPNVEINIGDLNALNPAVIAPTARPPMFGGQPAFFANAGNGVGGCPWPP